MNKPLYRLASKYLSLFFDHGHPPMDVQRKKLLFRARHMGTNENDIFFGGFAEENLPLFSKDQLDVFEKLMEINDADLFLWVTGAKPTPPEHDNEIMRMLQSFTLAQARR